MAQALSFRRATLVLAILSIGLIGSVATVTAHKGDHLDAPEFLTCNLEEDGDDEPGGEILFTDWTDVEGAEKYSVDLEARYDTDGDGSPDQTKEWSFGTSDREDDRPISESDLDIPFSELILLVDTDGDGEVDEEVGPSAVTVKVKGLNAPNGPQDHPFSQEISCTL